MPRKFMPAGSMGGDDAADAREIRSALAVQASEVVTGLTRSTQVPIVEPHSVALQLGEPRLGLHVVDQGPERGGEVEGVDAAASGHGAGPHVDERCLDLDVAGGSVSGRGGVKAPREHRVADEGRGRVAAVELHTIGTPATKTDHQCR